MQKYMLILLLMLSTITTSAQNYSTWFHHGNYHLSQCYDIIELSDGNIVVKEAVFDDNINDVGYNLYKITPQGELLDSLFVEDNHINSLSPMLRDPDREGINIMTSFYMDNDNGKNYYRAVYFSDDIELTYESLVELPAECPLPTRFMIDNNNDIVCLSPINNNTYRFMLIGLDGEVKNMSDIMTVSGNVKFSEHPLFVLSTEPLRYGYVTYNGSDIKVEIYDGDFIPISNTIINKFDGWSLSSGLNYNVNGCGDGYFFITITVLNSSNGHHGLMVVKLNSECEVISTYLWGEIAPNQYYPKYELVNKNLIVTNNSVFLVWTQKKLVESGSGSKTTLVVTRLDNDLNFSWEEYTLALNNAGLFGNYGLTSLTNGGVALSGWMTADNATYYDSKNIYAIVFDNYLSISEISASENPFLCYPNPAKDIVHIELSENSDCQSIEIYSLDGRLVKTCHGASLQNNAIDISNINSGVYIMKIRMANGKEFTERIIKE